MTPQAIAARYLSPNERMLIGGDWVDARSGRTLDVEDPATGLCFTQVPDGDAVDVDDAVAAARASFASGMWRNMPAADKSRILWKLSFLLESEVESLMYLEILDNGMPLSRARRIILRAIERLRFFAGMPTKVYGRTSEVGQGGAYHGYTLPEPVGVAGLITPWNGPLGMVCLKAAPALAAGCSIVIKPAEQTPMTALRFARMCLEAGIPPGVVNVVTGRGATAGAALVAHPGVDKISFTGSTAVGKGIVAQAATRLKRVTLELGGKSPVIVFGDADMAKAIPAVAAGIFSNSGQACIAGSRLYVQRKAFDQVVSGIADIARRSRVGSGLDAATDLGPLISRRQQERVMGYIAAGRDEGAELVTGGRAVGDAGYFVEPTVFTTTNHRATIAVEEIFGPVLTAMPFDEPEEVLGLANATRYGLAAGIFTRDLATAHRTARAVQAGMVWINCYGLLDPSMPFGGFKESGWGREGSFEGIEAYLEQKSVVAEL